MTRASPADTEWLMIAGVITAASAVVAAALMYSMAFTALPAPLLSLASWFGWTVFASGAAIIAYVFRLFREGEDAPVARIRGNWRSDKGRYVAIIAGMTLAGFDMYAYMILKPILDVLTPFWADPAIANLDHLLLGQDAWRFFQSWNLELVAWAYSPCWFFGLLLTFFWLLLRPPSWVKSAGIVSYFLIWSIFGTFGQALFPAGGPIFFERLGYGSRFAAMPVPPLERQMGDYLWLTYQHRSLAPGAGISAMPSLHIATMAWIVLVFASYRSKWLFLALPLSLFIYCGSMALGWHYAADGIVGGIGAAVCVGLCRAWFRRTEKAKFAGALALAV